jgi:hypothetical protein
MAIEEKYYSTSNLNELMGKLQQIVAVIGAYTKKELGFMCES